MVCSRDYRPVDFATFRAGQRTCDNRIVTIQQTRDQPALVALKSAHTLIWFSVEAALSYVIYSGLRGRSDRWAAIAGAIVAGETAVFLANGARCPLTGLAESLGAERASVTDLYLPRWLAHNLPAIHVPIVILAVYPHMRNRRRRKRDTEVWKRRVEGLPTHEG